MPSDIIERWKASA